MYEDLIMLRGVLKLDSTEKEDTEKEEIIKDNNIKDDAKEVITILSKYKMVLREQVDIVNELINSIPCIEDYRKEDLEDFVTLSNKLNIPTWSDLATVKNFLYKNLREKKNKEQ